MLKIADEADFPLATDQHVVDKPRDGGGVIHVELVGGQADAVALVGPIHEQHRQTEAADHFVLGDPLPEAVRT